MDTNSAIDTDHRREQLLAEIVEHGDVLEGEWLEVKGSRLDLSTPQGVGKLAIAIIGMANRDAEVAGRYCDGFGYIVLGVDRGASQGIPLMDPTHVTDKVKAFLEREGPVWHPVWVRHGDAHALIVEVPPQPSGSPIFCLERSVPDPRAGSPAGSIYVRSGASTRRHSPGELRRLTARARGSAALFGITVDHASGVVHRLDLSESAIEQWLSDESFECLRSLPSLKTHQLADPLAGKLAAIAQYSDRIDNFARAANAGLGLPTVRETRTEDEYRDEVAKYLGLCRAELRKAAISMIGELEGVRLRLTNTSNKYWAGVQLELHVPGNAYASRRLLRAANDSVPMPRRPRRFGDYTDNSALKAFGRIQNAVRSMPDGLTRGSGDHITIQHGGSVTITIPVGALRPGQAVTVEPVIVATSDPSQGAVSAGWTITGECDGTLTGTVALRCAENRVTPRDLFGND